MSKTYRVIKIEKENGTTYSLIQKKYRFLLWTYWKTFCASGMLPTWTVLRVYGQKYWNTNEALVDMTSLSKRENNRIAEISVVKEINV